MKIILKLQHKDGFEEEVRWGSIPEEWHKPILFDVLDAHGEKPDHRFASSTAGKITFKLFGVEEKGFWFFKRKIAYYNEE